MANDNSSTTGHDDAGSLPAGSTEMPNRFPGRMVAFSILCLAIGLILRFGYEWLNEWINLNPGVPNVIQLVLLLLVICGWNLWIAFFSRWRWVSKLVGVVLLGVLPILGLVFFQPLFDGDLGFVRFEPRFGSLEKRYAQLQQASASDQPDDNLQQSSEFDFPQFLGL